MSRLNWQSPATTAPQQLKVSEDQMPLFPKKGETNVVEPLSDLHFRDAEAARVARDQAAVEIVTLEQEADGCRSMLA